MKIAHVFVHAGTESEYLKEFGEIHGYGLEFETTINFDKSFTVDLTENDLKEQYDFGLFHPPCQKWAKATVDKHLEQNLIPRARELGEKYCDYYIIENVPKAPLRDSVTLNGAMFDKGIRYERQFESNFEIKKPEYKDRVRYDHNIQSMRKVQAGNIKEYQSGYYHVNTIKRNATPKYYLKYLLSYCPLFDIENPLKS
ncbi:MAG: hypothetical protein ACLFUH_01125 [Bacteroidales bacterium]